MTVLLFVTICKSSMRFCCVLFQLLLQDPNSVPVAEGTCDEQGRIQFTSRVGGEHLICLRTSSSGWFGSAREFVRSLPREFTVYGVTGGELNRLTKICMVAHRPHPRC